MGAVAGSPYKATNLSPWFTYKSGRDVPFPNEKDDQSSDKTTDRLVGPQGLEPWTVRL